jgi:hypothetical protein
MVVTGLLADEFACTGKDVREQGTVNSGRSSGVGRRVVWRAGATISPLRTAKGAVLRSR